MNALVADAKFDILSKIGRARNGLERDAGRLFHAVREGAGRALCGTEPGRSSAGWSSYPGDAVTCPRCQKAIANAALANVVQAHRREP